MIDHIALPVSDLATSKAFYEKALAPLGYGVCLEFPEAVGYGANDGPDFWIVSGEGAIGAKNHVAFHAANRALANAFHAAALAAGGRDNGTPGLCPEYHPHYYGAFVFDPDGHNIEAVCHDPE